MSRRRQRSPSLRRAVMAIAWSAVFALGVPSAPPFASDGGGALLSYSRAPYTHRINIYDENGQAISPGDSPAMPFSMAATCVKCHAYDTIGRGWHFNAADPAVPAGRPGEPWILTDLKTGTQIPLSDREWRGAHRPADVGQTPWNFVQTFGRHMPGGGVGERRDDEAPDPGARWHVSGAFEADCLSCHSSDPAYDFERRATQIAEQNLRWAPSAASGLASVRGSARKAPDFYDPLMPPNPDYPDQSGPITIYDPARFDPDDRVLFPMPVRAPNDRCNACHTTRLAAPFSAHGFDPAGDVHMAAGMSCSDCHTHGLDHAMIRGYEGEEVDYHRPVAAEFSCRGCHLGEDSAGRPIVAGANRFAAPRPAHKGLPPIHLETMSCTSCHSGPLPAPETGFVQTSMAHALGLSRRDRRPDEPPYILAPVFMRQEDGKIGPHKTLWPAWWGWVSPDGEATPMAPDEVLKAAGAALAGRSGKLEDWEPLTGEQVAKTLAALNAAREAKGEAVYMVAGRLLRLDEQGEIQASEHPAAAPYAWPLGHDVRPASQSLGATGCGECHADEAPFFYAAVAAAGPASLETAPVKRMMEFQGLDADAIAALNRSFALRTTLKAIGYVGAGLVGALLLLYGLIGLHRVASSFAGKGA